MIAQRLENTAHDTVTAGVDLNTHLGLVVLAGVADSVGMDLTIFQLKAVSDLLHILDRHVLIQPDMIDLLLLEGRMCQLGSQVAIVRQQQHTGRIAVQTTYRIDTFLASVLHQVHDSQTLLRIIGGCHTVLRLVQYDINLALDLDLLVVEYHDILTSDLRTQLCYHYVVHLDRTFLDKLIGLTTGTNPSVGQELIQTDRLVRVSQYFLILQLLLQAIFGIRIVSARAAVIVIIIRTTVIVIATTLAVSTSIGVATIAPALGRIIVARARLVIVHAGIPYARSSLLQAVCPLTIRSGRIRL